jgi:spermidine synthase
MKPLTLASLVVAVLGGAIAVLAWFAFPTPEALYGPVVHEQHSAFSHLRVRERGTVRSLLFVDEAGDEQCQSSIDLADPGTLRLGYTRGLFLSLLHRDPQRRVLILGLGGGGMVRFLGHHFPATVIEAVEIDPAVVAVARSHFGIAEGPAVRLHTADAFDFVAQTAGTYDAIYLDAFLRAPEASGLEEKTRRLKTREFLHQLRDRLTPGGLVAFNLIAADPRTEEDLAAIREVFPGMGRFAVPESGNLVVMAPREGAIPGEEEWGKRAAAFDARHDLGFSLVNFAKARLE